MISRRLRALALGLALAMAGSAAATPPTVAEVRSLLRQPRGSLSLGWTNGGSLVRGVEVPLRGRGYAFFSFIKGRRSNYGTVEMLRLIQRAASAVRRQYKGAVLGIGNISVEEGGPVGQSVSHRSGRDVDLGMYALDRKGRPVVLRGFVKFGPDGWDKAHRYRFDRARNLALIVSLMTDPEAQIQWIFVADWLKTRLIAEAWEQGVEPKLIERMALVLHQPGDSNPHQDHYHVRIYCSVDDRRHGCHERGPLWDWIDLGDSAFEAYVGRLVEATAVVDARWRVRVIEHLGRIRASTAVPRLLELLGAREKRVRTAALDALRAVGDAERFPTIVEALKRVDRSDLAASLCRIALSLDHDDTNTFARAVLDRPADVLAAGVTRTGPMVRAALYRLGIRGDVRDAPRLLVQLSSRHKKTRKAANRALERLTGVENGERSDGQSLAAAWKRFFKRRPASVRAQWFAYALKRAGVRLARRPDWSDVPALIGTLRHRDVLVAHTASRLLTHITGHPIDPKARSQRNTQRAWRTFWRHLAEFTAAEAETRMPRRVQD